ncbi:hypothetical protein [Brevibacillus dissolubilis]|uniref:hypothetical protein n=1 Tax=Brevibacillus dissolubilis TaxID=1844116 RepID=UPI001116559F|nr:hypothetical protein [Brevibacillus dissolubilis]
MSASEKPMAKLGAKGSKKPFQAKGLPLGIFGEVMHAVVFSSAERVLKEALRLKAACSPPAIPDTHYRQEL